MGLKLDSTKHPGFSGMSAIELAQQALNDPDTAREAALADLLFEAIGLLSDWEEAAGSSDPQKFKGTMDRLEEYSLLIDRMDYDYECDVKDLEQRIEDLSNQVEKLENNLT